MTEGAWSSLQLFPLCGEDKDLVSQVAWKPSGVVITEAPEYFQLALSPEKLVLNKEVQMG